MAKAPETKTTKRLIITSSHKGGVGKTIVARLMTEVYREEKVNADIYDADGNVGGLARVYRGPMDVKFYSFREHPMTLLNSLDTNSDIVFHDLPGGSLYQISKIVDPNAEDASAFLDTVEAEGFKLTCLHVIDSEIESTQSVREVMKSFDPSRVDHVVAINMREAKNSQTDFPYWYGYDVAGERKYGATRDAFVEGKGIEFEVPSLQVSTRAKVNGENLPFSVASQDKEKFTITERAQVTNFLKAFKTNIVPARKVLGLS